MRSQQYDNSPPVGRFAPSPTGDLHFGSLVAALGSYVLARQAGGRWLLRVEDLDPPRVVPGSANSILAQLSELGFEWDGDVLYQSRRFERYREVLHDLLEKRLVFPCSCTRRELIASAPHSGEDGPVYPGTCRNGPVGQRPERSFRLRVPDRELTWQDAVFGQQRQNLQREVGDFVLQRADGLYAYQLAVVVDDIDSGVTQVVRGADLLSSTPRQNFLYRCLDRPAPGYCHLPLALGSDGHKLSKRHGRAGLVTGVNGDRAVWAALEFLGQQCPAELQGTSAAELISWAVDNFSVSRVASQPQPAPELA